MALKAYDLTMPTNTETNERFLKLQARRKFQTVPSGYYNDNNVGREFILTFAVRLISLIQRSDDF